MWVWIVVAAAVIFAMVFACVLIWDRLTPLARHPLYESVFDQVRELEARKSKPSNVERRS
jgi:hypothetical protein